MEGFCAHKPTLRVRDVAVLLGIAHETAYRAIRRGEIGAVKIGNRRIVPLHEVERILGHELGADVLAWAEREADRKRASRRSCEEG